MTDLRKWYISIIRQTTERDNIGRPLQDRTMIQERSADTDLHWGYFWAEVGYQMGPAFDALTLVQAAHMELAAVERILMRALPRQQTA